MSAIPRIATEFRHCTPPETKFLFRCHRLANVEIRLRYVFVNGVSGIEGRYLAI
jgi:hypothetical protein